MTVIVRKAGVIQNGHSHRGNGIISSEGKVFYAQPHSSRSALKKNGFSPKETETNPECRPVSCDDDREIAHMALHVRAEVPYTDGATFQKFAKEAENSHPVSKALRNGFKIDLKADLI